MCINYRVQEALDKFHRKYITSPDSKHLRFGQMFVNLYIKEPWPELFYEREEMKAAYLIADWLDKHQYFTELPQPINRTPSLANN